MRVVDQSPENAKPRHAKRKQLRKSAASALVCALIFALTPATVAWADEPATVDEVPGEIETDAASKESASEEPSAEGNKLLVPEDEEALAPLEGVEAAPFAVGDGTLSVTASQQTGTEPFQDNDDPGNDAGPNNDIIRTNDTITYNLGIRYEGEDQTTPTVDFTVPQGQELLSLPPFCLSGSSVTPESLPDPNVPLTSDSWKELPPQEVTCVLKGETAGTSLDYSFITKVRSEVPHGTTMDPMIFEVATEQVQEPAVTEPLTQTVSSTATFDISKQDVRTTGSGSCNHDSSIRCTSNTYGLTMTVPSAGKGSAPLTSPIQLTDDLRPESFFGPQVWATMIADAGDEETAREMYGPRMTECKTHSGGIINGFPFGRITVSTKI